ncbi:MAG: metallophosphoesterase [Bacteroidota bacterium]
MILSSCRYDTLAPEAVVIEKKGILFLGHPYDTPTTVDPRIELLDLTQYEQIWLGGDICSETTKALSTVQYIDTLFDVSSPNTHWAVGNHDIRNGNLEWITDATQRKLFYSHSSNGMTILVLNSNLDRTECEEKEAQFQFIQQLTDTISESSHLFLLMHHIVWGKVEDGMDAISTANAGSSWMQFRCNNSSKFEQIIYPLLQQVQARGVQVMVISGDGGQKKSKTYEYLTDDGIWFLISGINNVNIEDPVERAKLPPDRVLYLELDPESRRLRWEFPDLDLLVEESQE